MIFIKCKFASPYNDEYTITFHGLIDIFSLVQEERPIIQRGRAAGLYRLSAYWMAKQTSELPLTITMPIVHTLICYFAVGLSLNVWVFIGHITQLLNYILAVQVSYTVLII